MTSGSFLYELVLLKKRKMAVIFFVILIIVFIILFFYLPLNSDLLPDRGYPQDVQLEDMLIKYEQEIQRIYNDINNGKSSLELAQPRLELLNYFLSSNTCEYDYVYQFKLVNRYAGSEPISYTISLLDGFSLIMPFISVFLASYSISLPLEKRYVRQMIETGTKRDIVYKTKNYFGLILIYILILIISIIAFAVLKPYYHQKVLLPYNESYLSAPLWNIALSTIVGLFLSGTFYFFCGELVGLLTKKNSLAIVIPIVLYIVLFICSNVNAPSWGKFGELTGLSKMATMLMPFSNIIVLPTFGFEYEVVVVLVIYFILNILLYFINRHVFRRIAL